MKLLNLPAYGAHLLYVITICLSGVVGYDLIRAVSTHHNPKQLHFIVFRKFIDLN